MKRRRECVYGAKLDLATLVWASRGGFSLGDAGEPNAVSRVRVEAGETGVYGAVPRQCPTRQTNGCSIAALRPISFVIRERASKPWIK